MNERFARGNWAELAIPFETALARIPEALGAEGFGVLTQIDVKSTLANKLGVDFRNYRILGACNPGFAHRALTEQVQAGMLLPCNVVLYETDDRKTVLGIVDPKAQLGDLGDASMKALADDVTEKLSRVMTAARAWR